MNSSNRALYEQVILDHNRNPRNFKEMENPDRQGEGYNALCGDQFTVYLKLNGDMIEAVTFKGAGCAISKSSASLMTSLLTGKSVKDAEKLFQRFHEMVTSKPDAPIEEEKVGKLKVFSGVREFPVRIKCATLPWHTLLAALDEKEGTVATE